MILAGIDASAASTGLAWIGLDDNEFRLIAVQAVRTNLAAHRDMTHLERLDLIYHEVRAAFEARPADIVHLEQLRISVRPGKSKGYGTILTARALQSAALGARHAGCRDIRTSAATEWRALIGCGARKTAEAKEKVRALVNTKFLSDLTSLGKMYRDPRLKTKCYGISSGENDMSDAVGLAMTARLTETPA